MVARARPHRGTPVGHRPGMWPAADPRHSGGGEKENSLAQSHAGLFYLGSRGWKAIKGRAAGLSKEVGYSSLHLLLKRLPACQSGMGCMSVRMWTS